MFSDIQVVELQTYHKMMNAQQLMHEHLDQLQYVAEELIAVQKYNAKHKAYVEFLSQTAKADWIDENTSLFHESIRAGRMQN